MGRTMNKYLEALMDCPSIEGDVCCICGMPCTNSHHVVFRSQGGENGPTVPLCGSGCTGHHGMAHQKLLHFRYEDGWMFLFTPVPTKYEAALRMGGWKGVYFA